MDALSTQRYMNWPPAASVTSDSVPERLRGCTRNALGSARVSSSLTAVAFAIHFVARSYAQVILYGHFLTRIPIFNSILTHSAIQMTVLRRRFKRNGYAKEHVDRGRAQQHS